MLEVQLTNTPGRKEGEPTLAINPKNPNNLVMMYASFQPGNLISETAYGCALQYSMDRGATWTLAAPWPPAGFLEALPECGESTLVVDADGTFYAAMNTMYNSADLLDSVFHNVGNNVHAVSSSRDGGRTWSKAVITHKISAIIKARADQVTGKLYHFVSTAWMFPQSITVSSDHGSMWTAPIDVPAAQYAVHDGIFVMSGFSPDVTIHVSMDDGKSYMHVPVTDSAGKPVLGGREAEVSSEDPPPWVTADPTQSKRFAVMVPRQTSGSTQGFTPVYDSFEVYVTEDVGQTWTGPARIAAPWAAIPWIEFGSGGELGVAWRGMSAKGETTMVDAYAAVSFDHGRTFSAPVRVNAESHRWGDGGPPADDWSTIKLDKEFAFVSWIDVRSGDITGDVIMARVPLSVFRGASN